MARYVDGFVIPVPRRNLATYRSQAARAGKIWREHGALEYVEAVGDDLKVKGISPFAHGHGEVRRDRDLLLDRHKSRAHRDRVNAKVMKDPRILKMMNVMPFDGKRMTYGGFKVVVDL